MSCFGITTSSQMGVDLCFVHHAIGISNHEVSLSSILQRCDCQVSFTKSITGCTKGIAIRRALSPRPLIRDTENRRKERSDMRSSRGGQPSRECVFREAERPRLDPLSTLSLFGGRENQFWTTRLYYLLISMRPITGEGMDAGEFIITYHTCGSMDSGHW